MISFLFEEIDLKIALNRSLVNISFLNYFPHILSHPLSLY